MIRKASVDAKAFSTALDQVSKVLRKSSIPVLSEVLVAISGGQCALTATDIETWLFQKIPARGDDLSFVFRKTKDVAKACRLFDGELELEFSDTGEGKYRSLTLCMRCGGRAVEFEAMAAEDYPVCAPIKAKASFAVNAAALLKRVELVGYAAGKPASTERATCGNVQFSGKYVFALDGTRLACDTDESLMAPRPFMTYAESLSHLRMFGDQEVTVELGERQGVITNGTASIIFRINGVDVYPVDGAVPHSCQEEFYVQTRDFLRELKYLKEFTANERKPYVRFTGGCLFMPTSTGKCSTRVEIDGHSDTTFAFPLPKMLDAVRQFKDEPRVKLKITSAVSPIMVEADGRGDFALVCPVRLTDRLMAA